MVILHIAQLDGFQGSGVNVVVPQHVINQRKYADAALWNIREPIKIDGLAQNFSANSLDELPEPYCKPDIAVFHELYIPPYLKIAKALRKRGIPYVVVPHSSLNLAAQQKSKWKKLIANTLLFKPFCNQAAGIQCLSETERAECAFGNNPFVATNGIYPQKTTKNGFHTDKIRFVYIGRLQPYIKGLDILIQAFAKEKAFLKANRCTLDIYGPDDDRGTCYAETVQNMIRSENADGLVTLHSAAYGEEKTRVLLDSDIYIQTSRNEGMPMGILEALSIGLPCLVTKGTTLDRLVSKYDAGWTAETNSDAVAQALKTAVAQKNLLTKKSANALQSIQEFEWNKVAKTAVNAYGKLCEREQ